MKYLLLSCCLFISGFCFAEMKTDLLEVPAYGKMNIGVFTPDIPTIADILFFHGHADSLSNHKETFARWAQQGYRTISFDLPLHGDSQLGPLDRFQMEELIGLGLTLEKHTREKEDRPLIVAGWSFGGLLATHLAQNKQLQAQLQRPIDALVLITPAIAVHPMAGGDGISRLATLTHNKNLSEVAKPSPASPLLTPMFALRLLQQAWQVRNHMLPAKLPTVILIADESADWYVNSTRVREWSVAQQKINDNVIVFQCHGARHALELEPYPTGHWVREFTTAFMDHKLDQQAESPFSTTDWNNAFKSTCSDVES